MNKDKELRDILVEQLLQANSLEYSLDLARAIGRLCFTADDIFECREPIRELILGGMTGENDTRVERLDCADFVLLCSIHGMQFILDHYRVRAVYRPGTRYEVVIQEEMVLEYYFQVPEILPDVLRFLTRLRKIRYPPITFCGKPVQWMGNGTFDDEQATQHYLRCFEVADQIQGKVVEHDFEHGGMPIQVMPCGALLGGGYGTLAIESMGREASGEKPLPMDILGNMEVYLDSMVTRVDPSIIRRSPRLQNIITETIRAFYDSEETVSDDVDRGVLQYLLRLLPLNMRMDLLDVITWTMQGDDSWEGPEILDILHDMSLEQFEHITTCWLDDIPVWVPLPIQRQLVRKFFEDCAASEDPVHFIASEYFPYSADHRQAWDLEMVKPFHDVIVQAAKRYRDSDTVWEILKHVAIEELESMYVEEYNRCCPDNEQISPEQHVRACQVIQAIGALPTRIVCKYKQLLLAARDRFPTAAPVCLRHSLTSMNHNFGIIHLRLFAPPDPRIIQEYMLDDPGDKGTFFSMDPAFISPALLHLFEDDFILAQQLLGIMPGSVFQEVARHRLENGNTFIEEILVMMTSDIWVPGDFIHRLFLLDKCTLRPEILLPFIHWSIDMYIEDENHKPIHMMKLLKNKFCDCETL